MSRINDLFVKEGDVVEIQATNFHSSERRTEPVVEKITSTNSRYATALSVLEEYGCVEDVQYQDERTFETWLKERLHSAKAPNDA